MGARRSQQDKDGHFELNIPILPAEKWEVTKAGLLLPRQEMFLARAAHSAFLGDTFLLQALPWSCCHHGTESLFPRRDLLLQPARCGMCVDPTVTALQAPGAPGAPRSRLCRNFVSLAWSTRFSPWKTRLKTTEISKPSAETPEERRICMGSGHGS